MKGEGTRTGVEAADDITNPQPGFSIVIPTRNSASRIGATLDALEFAIDRLARTSVEIIVVDNASDEDIHAPIQAMWAGLGTDVKRRIVCEPRLGAAYARVNGLKEASNSIIVYCDDDVLPAPDSLQTIAEIARDEPTVGGGGGWIKARLVDGAQWPSWMDDALMANLAVIPRDCTASYSPPETRYPVSALIWFRKEALGAWARLIEKPDAFVFGPAGNEMWRGDDFEMDITVMRSGWQIKVDPRIRAEHCIPPARLTSRYFASLIYWNGRTAQRWQNKWLRKGWAYEALRVLKRIVVDRDPTFVRAVATVAKGAPPPLDLDVRMDAAGVNHSLHALFQLGVAQERVLRVVKPSVH